MKALTSELTMVSGKKYTFLCEIKGTFTPQPAPGDFYCTNASNEVVIFPGAATSLPEGLTCHGIVFHYLDDFSSFCTTNGIDNADNKYPGYGDDSDKKHGLVIGFSAGGSFMMVQNRMQQPLPAYTKLPALKKAVIKHKM